MLLKENLSKSKEQLCFLLKRPQIPHKTHNAAPIIWSSNSVIVAIETISKSAKITELKNLFFKVYHAFILHINDFKVFRKVLHFLFLKVKITSITLVTLLDIF